MVIAKGSLTIKFLGSWYFCTYHDSVFYSLNKEKPTCQWGDNTYANHCTCMGPYDIREKAEMQRLVNDIKDCGCC